MSSLRVSLAQRTRTGRDKHTNQDCHGACLPEEPVRTTKGVALAIADGIGSSTVSHTASASAVTGFLTDYLSTPESWSVKQSAWRVLMALNAWLHAQTRRSRHRYDMERGYVCTFSALVIRGCTAHLFHVGDSRIYRLRDGTLELLTTDHRLWLSATQHSLSRALGFQPQLELEYRALEVRCGDIFLLSTDGVHESCGDGLLGTLLKDADTLEPAAEALLDHAQRCGSRDDLTVQLLRIDALPSAPPEARLGAGQKPPPPALAPRMLFEGYRLLRALHASSRSHLFLARDEESGQPVVLKTLSTETADDAASRERLLMEEWIARRLDSPHVLRAAPMAREKQHLYSVMEFIDGQTLRQWMKDHPRAGLAGVRDIAAQIARGLRAFHRQEMLHQDLRPENVMISTEGTALLIDFGATRVAGLHDLPPRREHMLLGTAAYTAPECLLGQATSERTDLYALAVMTYEMLSGQLPYGTATAAVRTRAQLLRLQYRSVRQYRPDIPEWIDATLRKACHPDATKRYAEPAEFIHDLYHPDGALQAGLAMPLMARYPVQFWQAVSGLLAAGWVATVLWQVL